MWRPSSRGSPREDFTRLARRGEGRLPIPQALSGIEITLEAALA